MKNVAIKIFLKEYIYIAMNTSISERLELAKKPEHLKFSYWKIRQEVAFLSHLDHPNLTKLCGVRFNPCMCLLLELAPKGSLYDVLKEYRKCAVVLEPGTLKNTALQV